MDLILTVETCPSHSNLLNHTKVFQARGGMVGRSEKCDWVLTDMERVVSSRHFEVRYTSESFHVIDHSTNGTFVNESTTPLGVNNDYLLKSGDLILCGDYHLRVLIKQPKQQGASFNLGAVDFLDSSDRTTFNAGAQEKQEHASSIRGLDDLLRPKEAGTVQAAGVWGSIASDSASFFQEKSESDPLKLLEGERGSHFNDINPKEDWWGQASFSDQSHLMQQDMSVPKMRVEETDSIDMLLGITPQSSSSHVEPLPALQKVEIPDLSTNTARAKVPEPHNLNMGVNKFTEALGLGDLAPAQAESVISEAPMMLSESLTQLIGLLKERTTIKNELRVQHTMIQSSNNNPLKFSGNATEALRMLFNSGVSSFMKPTDAVKDGFEDLSDHQFAVLKATQRSYEYMLQQFDPFEITKKIGAHVSRWGSGDAKKWKAYEDYYASLKLDYESTYSRLFGETFAKEYERIIADLKNRRLMG